MKKILMVSACIVVSLLGGYGSYGQTVLSSDFNASLPAGWTVDASGGAKWEHSTSFGVGGSGCGMVDKSNLSGGSKGMLITPAVNLATVTKPTLSFNIASIRNNFMSPNLYVYYSVAGGAWQKLSSWGEWNMDNDIITTGPCFPQNTGCIEWQHVAYDLAKVANHTNIRFAFEADCFNGGWMLLDNVWIHDKKIYPLPYTQDFEGTAFFPQDWDRTGTNTAADWQRSVTVGAFNSNSSAFFDNYSLNNTGETYGMSTVWLDLSTANKPTLSFEYAYVKRTGKPSDELRISYTIAGGVAWAPIDSFKDNKLETSFARTTAFMPNNRDWLTKTIDLTNIPNNKEVRFALECKTKNGNILYIDNVRFYDDTTSTTSVASVERQGQFSLYPNPAQDILYIEKKAARAVAIAIYDVTGRQMSGVAFRDNGDKVTINTTQLSNGAYYIHVEQGGFVTIKQFFINK